MVPRMPWNAALVLVARWSVLLGGLVIIADLGTLAILQKTTAPDIIDQLGLADHVANIVLFSILGSVIARRTGVFYLATLAGLLASLLDGLVFYTAASMALPPGGVAPIDQYLLFNMALGTVSASVSGLVSTFIERMSGPRAR
jgi:hypothetical protein